MGQGRVRVTAFDTAAGGAKYTDDLCDGSALVPRLVHSTVAHGMVTAIDTSEAEAVPGVVKVFTCFDVPEYYFPTAGHPRSTDPPQPDVADRLLVSRPGPRYRDGLAGGGAGQKKKAPQGGEGGGGGLGGGIKIPPGAGWRSPPPPRRAS